MSYAGDGLCPVGVYPLPAASPAVLVPLVLLLFIYIAFAWDIWWYGGSLGQRSMVQAYAVLSPGDFVVSGWTAYLFAVFCLFLPTPTSGGPIRRTAAGLFASEQMNRPYFQRIFLRNEGAGGCIQAARYR